MENFIKYKPNELIRLDLTFNTIKGVITETIFAEFISINYLKGSDSYIESIQINQIIDIDDYLKNGNNFRLVERVIGRQQLGIVKYYYNSYIAN